MEEYKEIKKVFKETKGMLDQAGDQMSVYEEEASHFKQKIEQADQVIQTLSSKAKRSKTTSASTHWMGLIKFMTVLTKQMRAKNN